MKHLVKNSRKELLHDLNCDELCVISEKSRELKPELDYLRDKLGCKSCFSR